MAENAAKVSDSLFSTLRRWLDGWPCSVIGHRWRSEFIGGHVHAGDDWEGERLDDGTPYISSWINQCVRCGRWE